MRLANDIARCAGTHHADGKLLEECEVCARRLAPGGEVHMVPPAREEIKFYCPHWIAVQ